MLGAAAAHSLDFDDTHARSQLHPGAPVIPTALAAAQMVGASTQELLAGIAAGYEVMIRVAYGVNPLKHSERGFHMTATCGVFGAAAAAGNILKLTPEQMEHAFGTALSESAGTGQFAVNGAWTKRFHVGHAAASGLMAAVLASKNYTGATQALEGREGFFNAYSSDPQPEAALEGLGEVWEIMASGIKPYPCCRGIHAPLDAIFDILSKHKVDIDKIESVRVGMAKRSVNVVGEPQERRRNPRNVVDCQFSTHFCVAAALVTGTFGWDSYEPGLANQAIRDLMQRVVVFEDEECNRNFPIAFSSVVEIKTQDGENVREFVYAPRGEPDSMFSDAELRAKFQSLVVERLGAPGESALFEAIQNMVHEQATAALIATTRPNEA
jgi:2-methylcitrate dehydratase PrpD